MKTNIFLITMFSAICLSFSTYYFLVFFNVIEKNELDLGNIEIAQNFDNTLFAEYQNFIEKNKVEITNTFNQQFPNHIEILRLNTQLNKSLNRILYDSVFKENYKFIPIFHNSQYNTFIDKDNKFIISIETYLDYKNKIEDTTNIINTLADRHKDINMNVYIVCDIGSTDLINSIPQFIDIPNLVDIMATKFNSNVKFDYLKYSSLEEYQTYFFKSDHHWNYTGAYQGYCDIVKLFKNIGEPLPLGEYRYVAENIKYRGSLARMAVDYSVYDRIFDGGIIVPEYSVSINNYMPMDNIYPNKTKYFNGDIKYLDFYGHYANFFHGDYKEIHYKFNKGYRNLLIIADSVSDCVDDLIASHFNNTYVLDLRFFKDFNFEKYIKEKQITDVLFLNLNTTMLNSFPDYKDNFIE